MRTIIPAGLLVSLLAAGAAAPAGGAGPAPVPLAAQAQTATATGTGTGLLTGATPRHGDGARCDLCHTTTTWQDARFAHERTGFALRGRHAETSCGACHLREPSAPVGTACTSCHRDVHAGAFGALCSSCHEERDWRPRFGADAHRRTAFPLTGRHALVPCEECHRDERDRTFSAPVACLSCHAADYERTALGRVNHRALGLGTQCRNCHEGWRWSGADLPGHDQCFVISGGAHAGIRCVDCHQPLTFVRTLGICATGTASCTSCHKHTCAKEDARHREVPAYECEKGKCFECHRGVQ